MSRTSHSIALCTSTALVLLGLSSITTLDAMAQVATSSAQLRPNPIKMSQGFRPRSSGTAPPTAGGATRGGSCLKGDKQLTSLVPPDRLGLTYSGRPTFHWYVPKSPAKTAKFLVLENEDTDVFYETTLTLPEEGGIISFTLPANAPALASGKQYHWFLVVGCSEIDQSANPSVEGWVERIAPEAAILSQLAKVDAMEQARIYAESGIWHEAVTTLAKLRQTNPQDATTIARWHELLKSVKLEAIAAEPLLNVTLSQN
ncbi:MAG: DUF928 domain-containing protein [Leptolyngbyaceae cyanobacterium bins.349]|nr:DUF928 domain-containing protein [Leptolyngbyaceae cyanobacterium bins.349]